MSVKIERILGLIAIAVIIFVWLAGTLMGEKDTLPYLKKTLPQADHFEHSSNGHYTAYTNQQIIGYLSITQANGYGGPMKIVTAVDMNQKVIGIAVIEQKETPSFFQKVMANHLFETLLNKPVTDSFAMGDDVDGISGATYSSQAIITAVSKGAHSIGKEKLNLKVPAVPAPEIEFGLPEITVLLLFIIGFVGRKKTFKYTRQARWISLLTGLIILGFYYNSPLTLAKISGLLMGYIPAWQSYIYWFLLIGGIFLFLTIDKKNPYCHWFCPFGAAQECLGTIGGAKVRTPDRFRSFLRWTQRCLAFLAVVLAILFRSPGISSYEIFGALFSLTGTTFQMSLVVIILIAALFLKRPWCSYLCPVPPVTDLVKMFRKWIGNTWTNQRKKTAI